MRIAFIGHPYNLFDVDINKDLLALAKSLDMEIMTSDLLSEKEIDREVSGLSKEIYWSSGREIVGSLFHFLSGVSMGWSSSLRLNVALMPSFKNSSKEG